MSMAHPQQKHFNVLHAEIGHPSEVITQSTVWAMGLNLTGILRSFEDCVLGKVRNNRVTKISVKHSKILQESLFFEISLPLTPLFGGKKQGLPVIEDSTDYKYIFLKEKSELKNVMLVFIKI